MTRPVRILFVEDSRDDVELILDELRRGGFAPEHRIVATAAAMGQALASETWDLVISDHFLRDFSAPAALEVLRAAGRPLPFIVVSEHIGEELAVACVQAGADDFLPRDNLARLLPAVERGLRESREHGQRLHAEDALRASEERYRLLVENSADIITVFDLEGRIEFQSPAATRLLGYGIEEMLGRQVLDFVHPDDAQSVTAAIGELITTGSVTPLWGLRLRRKDGSWRLFEASGSRLLSPEGQVRVLSTSRDIHERVQLESQLEHAQKMDAVGRLATGVAHDFNNLLTVMMGYSNLLLDQLAENRLLREEVEEIKRAAERATRLTQKLLAFGRRQPVELSVLGLNPIIENMAGMLSRLIREDIELVLHLDPALGEARVDPGLVEQVVMNLAVNARDAMPRGGRLSLETANVELDGAYARTHALKPGSYVMVAVSDTGTGMDAATRARLFEPFFTTKEKGKGTGLGLSTVYGIVVRQLGGSIFVYSEPGLGTSFKVYLPRVAAPGARPAARAEESLPPGGHEKVLLVEDDAMVRGLVGNVLRQAGYQVAVRAEARAALSLLRELDDPVALLVTDVVLPGMAGPDLAREADLVRPGLPVLFLSGYTSDLAERGTVLPAGAVFLQKPFPPAELLRRVRQLLDRPRQVTGPVPGLRST